MTKKEPTKLELIGDLLDLLDSVPLIDYSQPLDKMNASMKYAIAQFFANKELRSFLEYKISETTRSSAEKGDDPMAIAFNRGRLSLLKEIYEDGKKCFENSQKLAPLASRLEQHFETERKQKQEASV